MVRVTVLELELVILECYSHECANVNIFTLHAADAYDAVFRRTHKQRLSSLPPT